MTKKHEFKAPSDLMEETRGGAVAVAVAPVAPTAFVGTWSNFDKATRGLVKMVIGVVGSGISVHAFGACTPTPCDWGAVAGMVYADNVGSSTAVGITAQYKFGFKETIVVGHLDIGELIVETFDHFTDGSGRSDYYSRYYMSK
jgi:hypothetical protein